MSERLHPPNRRPAPEKGSSQNRLGPLTSSGAAARRIGSCCWLLGSDARVVCASVLLAWKDNPGSLPPGTSATSAEMPGKKVEAAASASAVPCDALSVRWTGGWGVAASAGASAVHVLAWPYAAVVLVVTAAYRLLAERARRKTLIDLVSHAPADTIVIMEKGTRRADHGDQGRWRKPGPAAAGSAAWAMTTADSSRSSTPPNSPAPTGITPDGWPGTHPCALKAAGTSPRPGISPQTWRKTRSKPPRVTGKPCGAWPWSSSTPGCGTRCGIKTPISSAATSCPRGFGLDIRPTGRLTRHQDRGSPREHGRTPRALRGPPANSTPDSRIARAVKPSHPVVLR